VSCCAAVDGHAVLLELQARSCCWVAVRTASCCMPLPDMPQFCKVTSPCATFCGAGFHIHLSTCCLGCRMQHVAACSEDIFHMYAT
jgi:hypothetical protein